MAHSRKRQVEDLYRQHLSFSPIVGVFGHRQVGKSTFISAGPGSYYSLDDEDELYHAHQSAKQFLKKRKGTAAQDPLIIDECQQEPKLFPALKEWVRKHKKPGQFVLSGSVRFTSRKAIRESLAGRMAFFEIFPFSISEIRAEPLPRVLPQLLLQRVFSRESIQVLRSVREWVGVKMDLERYLQQGGLPGLCFIREKQHRIQSLSFLHHLIIDRDIRMVFATKLSAATIRNFLVLIAKNAWNRYSFAEVRRVLNLAPQTQKNLLYAMEAVFLIRRIPIRGQKGEIILLEDQFEELTLSDVQLSFVRSVESAIYRNLRTQFYYRLGNLVSFETYHTRDGARVPIVIHSSDSVIGIIVIETSEPSLSEKRSAASFLGKYSHSKVIYASTEIIEPKVVSERALLASLYALL